MLLSVDRSLRLARMRAHTATHLLHAELALLFPMTQQAGSLVDADILRFDFQAPRALTDQELSHISTHINNYIAEWSAVRIDEMWYKDAIALWAKAFFEDKYGDVVRVVQIINHQHQTDMISIELCGGTHVQYTNHIGAFAIVSQESVASGIRRITAVTWPHVSQHLAKTQWVLDQISIVLDVPHKQLIQKIEKLTRDYDQMQTDLLSLRSLQVRQSLLSLDYSIINWYEMFCVDWVWDIVSFKELVNIARDLWQGKNFVIYMSSGNFAVVSVSGTAKHQTSLWWLKGWGNDQMVQGRDDYILRLLT